MEGLKNCPFCGGNYIRCQWNYMGDGFEYREIHCNDCGATLTKYSPYIEDDNELIELWNTRVYPGDETADYFILPKPKEELTEHYNTIEVSDDGKVFMAEHINFIQDALDNWRNELDAKIQQKLFETFRPTCKLEPDGMHNSKLWYACTACGGYVSADYDPPNYCPHCGAKVVENG